jgi:hypothetical protein
MQIYAFILYAKFNLLWDNMYTGERWEGYKSNKEREEIRKM